MKIVDLLLHLNELTFSEVLEDFNALETIEMFENAIEKVRAS